MCVVYRKCAGEYGLLGVKGWRYKQWCSGKGDRVGCVGAMVKEELFEKVVEIRKACDRVMSFVLAFEEDMLRQICLYPLQSGRCLEEKMFFYDELKCVLDMHSAGDFFM